MIVFLFAFLTCHAQEKSRLIAHPASLELNLIGKKFGQEVERAFTKTSKAASERYYDLMPICEKYFPAGTSFADATEILIAAGARPDSIKKSIWAPAYNRSLPENSIDKMMSRRDLFLGRRLYPMPNSAFF